MTIPSSPPHEVTQLLVAWSKGDKTALDKLAPIVEQELRRLAHHYMRGERQGHTLQTTALVNEAYLRLVDARVDWPWWWIAATWDAPCAASAATVDEHA